MNIWVDDIRTPPDDNWFWIKTSTETIIKLEKLKRAWKTGTVIEVLSLDHDLGGDDTTRPVLLWMIEHNFWPVEIRIHTANPVGRIWLEGMIERYGNG